MGVQSCDWLSCGVRLEAPPAVLPVIRLLQREEICHVCRASKIDPRYIYVDFVRNPGWASTVRSHRQFLLQQVGEPINALIFVKGFHMTFLRFCSMHTINLGVGLFTNGGAMYELMKVGHFAGTDATGRFRTAFKCFKDFVKAQGIQFSQPCFKPWMLINSGGEYCYFTSKAACQH